jgi:hypothetical protein
MQKPKDGVKGRVLCLPHMTAVANGVVQRIMNRFKAICDYIAALAHHIVADVVVILLHGKHLVRSLSEIITVPI